ncbi:hypothetical protein [Anaeromicrobium sediminis]|uniref:Uncharacterized protein n=1 Tax=Anaeromicrobium sediminis TaxID=1478221 RepID=A0A267ML07_9FIRM|nr:hypothetical protein [Anaeromicrobium sediminis]PAB59565.1 hypothetical protein CCE28_10150 [Anaeromicrobium sediminis]
MGLIPLFISVIIYSIQGLSRSLQRYMGYYLIEDSPLVTALFALIVTLFQFEKLITDPSDFSSVDYRFLLGFVVIMALVTISNRLRVKTLRIYNIPKDIVIDILNENFKKHKLNLVRDNDTYSSYKVDDTNINFKLDDSMLVGDGLVLRLNGYKEILDFHSFWDNLKYDLENELSPEDNNINPSELILSLIGLFIIVYFSYAINFGI